MRTPVAPASDRPIERIGNDPSRIQGIPIQECGEPLVQVTNQPGIFVEPAYHRRNIGHAPDRIEVRAGVLARLRLAAAALPEGTGLLLWDGLRTLQTQAAIVEAFLAELPEAQRHDPELLATYLAAPPASPEQFRQDPPPHATGGAIDLTLCDASGRALAMGAGFDEFTESAWLAHFEADGDDSPEWRTHRDRRRILYWAMIGAGFAPYPWEFWHYEFGTMVAAVFYDLPAARYGAAVPWRSSR